MFVHFYRKIFFVVIFNVYVHVLAIFLNNSRCLSKRNRLFYNFFFLLRLTKQLVPLHKCYRGHAKQLAQ